MYKVWTQREVETECRRIAIKLRMDFNTPVKISKRMTVTKGRVRWTPSGEVIDITFSANLINGVYDVATVMNVIAHEMAHWTLASQGIRHSHGDDNFLWACSKTGCNGETYFNGEANMEVARKINAIKPAYQLFCSKCNTLVAEYAREATALKKLDPRFTSRCCGAILIYGGAVQKAI